MRRALALHQTGELAQAERLYREILGEDPRHFDALHLLGVIAAQTQNSRQALELLDRALAIDPSGAVTHFNRGTVLQDLKEWRAALASYDRATTIDPSFAEAFSNRGAVLTELGDWEAALVSCDRAIALRSEFAEAFFNRGNACREMRRFDEAVESYERAIARRSDYPEALYNRGNALAQLGHWQAAVESYERVITLKPRHFAAYMNRGHAQVELRQWEAALASYAKAREIKPDLEYLPGRLLYTRLRICDWRGIEGDIATLLAQVACGAPAAHPFEVLALTGSPRLQLAAARSWVRNHYPPDGRTPEGRAPDRVLPERANPARHERIRVGYFSADFHNHAVANLTAELYERHDRRRFEITAFSLGPDKRDGMRRRLEAAFERFIDVRARSDRDIALLARSLEIDIAVDLGGYTEGARTGIFALRAAPLQLSYIGYLGTMGAPFIDYLIADPTLIPPVCRPYYSERIIHLRSYQANDTRRPIAEKVFTREELGLPAQGMVFCCFNALWKITPAMFSAWMRILERVPGSVLFLYSEHPLGESNLREEAEARGVGAARLVFGGRLPNAEYLARYRTADLFLDTLPYNAGTTASDALWAGLPVLSCRGESFASRMASSLLAALDLPELITESLEDYEERAVDLAAHPGRLAQIRAKLAERRVRAPLFDARAFTENLECAYSLIYERHRAGLPPEDLSTSAPVAKPDRRITRSSDPAAPAESHPAGTPPFA